jgi:hypothetical protein
MLSKASLMTSRSVPVLSSGGKLRRLEGGDIVHAHDIVPKRVDGQDASFVRVRELLSDFFFRN